jgi:hypothetical protein
MNRGPKSDKDETEIYKCGLGHTVVMTLNMGELFPEVNILRMLSSILLWCLITELQKPLWHVVAIL